MISKNCFDWSLLWFGLPAQGSETRVHGRSQSMPDGEEDVHPYHHYQQNAFNERVAEGIHVSATHEGHLQQGRSQPQPQPQYTPSHYAERPLPARPQEAEDDFVSRVRVGAEPESPAPPGYIDPPSYPISGNVESDQYSRFVDTKYWKSTIFGMCYKFTILL